MLALKTVYRGLGLVGVPTLLTPGSLLPSAQGYDTSLVGVDSNS